MDQGCLTRLWFRMLVMGSTDPQLAEVPLKLSKYIFFVKNYCKGSTSLLSFSLYSLISFSPSWPLPYPWNSFSPCPYRPKSLSLTFSQYPNCPLNIFSCMNDRQLEWNVVRLASIIFLSLQDNVLPFCSPVFPKVTTTHPMGQGQTLPLSPLWSDSDLLPVETPTQIQLHLTSALSSWTISKTLSTLWACHFLPTSSSLITDHRKLLLPQTLGAQLQPTETVIYSICVSLSC